jgi:hypothetical protein
MSPLDGSFGVGLAAYLMGIVNLELVMNVLF